MTEYQHQLLHQGDSGKYHGGLLGQAPSNGTGIKGVQSLQNLRSYATVVDQQQNHHNTITLPRHHGGGALKGAPLAEEQIAATRVVSERTVCYCSNFDLDAAEWFRTYHQLKMFSMNLQNRFGKHAHKIQLKIDRSIDRLFDYSIRY